MKEQKELIEAALALVDALERRAWFEFSEEARLTTAAKAYRKAQEQPERRKAPWKDSEGNELFEGDEIRYANGVAGKIVFKPRGAIKDMRWLVKFEHQEALSFLLHEITGGGAAVKVTK